MRIDILVPRNGGPLRWGLDLRDAVNSNGADFDAFCFHTTGKLFKSPLWQRGDIIHTVIPIPYKLWKKPVILTIKGDFEKERKIWRKPYRIAIKKADVITVPSLFLKERLGIDDALVIPNALNSSNFADFVKKDYSASGDLNLLTATRFYFKEKAKGVLKLIEIVEKADCVKKLTIIGGGPYLEDVKRKAYEKSVKTDIEFLGEISKPYKQFHRFDAFLYYSEYDNFPNVLLEAAVSGMPILTNDVGAVKEFIEDKKTGLISFDDREYLENIGNIFEESLRKRLGESALFDVKRRFEWGEIVERYLEVYEGLLI